MISNKTPKKFITFTEEELRLFVQNEIQNYIAKVFSLNSPASIAPTEEWIEPKTAWNLLNLPNPKALVTLRDEALVLGKHYRITNPGKQVPRYQYNIQACKQLLSQDPAKYLKPKKR